MMDIYDNRLKFASFRLFRRFSFLVGINITRQGAAATVEPVYMPLIKVERIGKITILSINPFIPWLTVLFHAVFPFVNVIRANNIILEEEDEHSTAPHHRRDPGDRRRRALRHRL